MTDSLAALIRAGHPLVGIETTDEPAAVAHVRRAAEELGRPLLRWSVTGGLHGPPPPTDRAENAVPGPLGTAGGLKAALKHLLGREDRPVALLLDAAQYAKDAVVYRTLRDLAAHFGEAGGCAVLCDAVPPPDPVRPFLLRYEVPRPGPDRLRAVVKKTFRDLRRDLAAGETPGGPAVAVEAKLSKSEVDRLVQTLRGLTETEARRAVAGAILDDHALTAEDLPRLADAKKRLVASTGCLESITADFAPDDLGGLAKLKDWLRGRRGGFDAKAEAFGLEPPRGVLMLGVPGCGKSLCAKVVAADWGLPLLRLDPGVLYQKFIGASEGRLREALRQAEATAPCVLWVDEIEKAFASAGASGGSDGGLSRRMFGTLLSWMQDHRHPIFLVATANDLSALPPELMRKGRFDEVFFVDLPDAAARRAVFAVHLRRRGRNPDDFDLDRLAAASDGFSGAELEQAVVSALFAAYRAGGPGAGLSGARVEAALAETKPLSVLNAEKIAGLRAWAEKRCVPAG